MALLIAILIIGVFLLFLIVTYNSLVSARNQVDNAAGSVDTMLKKRFDLIPNLVETVKTYMNYEQSTLTKITELRTSALSDHSGADEKMNADKEVSSLMSKVILDAENYPVLQADVNFIQLQQSWADVEENISAARRAYNAAVTDYNNAFESFPGNLFAGTLHFQAKKTFEATAEERENISAKALFTA